MTRKAFLGFMVLMAGIVCGENTVQAKPQFPETYKLEKENVVFHATVEVPQNFEPDSLKRSTADTIRIDGENAFEYFCKGQEITESYEDPVTGEFYRKLADGSSFSYIPPGYIVYLSENMPYYWGAFRYYDNREDYAQEKSFSFFSKEECAEELVRVIEEAGYGAVFLGYEFYYLDHATMEKNELHENFTTGESDSSKYKRCWSQEDDAYQIYAMQELQGLPVYHSMLSLPEDDDNGCLISGIYSSRGIENLSIIDVFQFYETDEKIELLPFEDCAEKVLEKYNRLLTESIFTVNRATLYQYIERDKKTGKNQRVIPIWYFDVFEEGPDTENPEEKIMRDRVMLVNAETGEEIIAE